MARPGPARRPIEDRKADGTLRPSDAKTPVVVAGRTAPKPAAYLTPGQKREFRRLVKELGVILDSADRGLVELAAIQADIIATCNAMLATSLTDEVTRGAYRGTTGFTVEEPSVYFRMRQDAAKELRQLYGELGIGPGARAALGAGGVKGKSPAQALPGVGAKPTPLRVVNGESE